MLTIIAILLFILALPSIIEIASVLPLFLLVAVLWLFSAIGWIILIPMKILGFIADCIDSAIEWIREKTGLRVFAEWLTKKLGLSAS